MHCNITLVAKSNGTAVPHTYDDVQMQHHTFDATQDQNGFVSTRASFNSRKVAALSIMGRYKTGQGEKKTLAGDQTQTFYPQPINILTQLSRCIFIISVGIIKAYADNPRR
jgi:hypothetical protein